jgi:hypothetical protein
MLPGVFSSMLAVASRTQPVTKIAAGGGLALTNTPDPTINNFRRIRAVPRFS